jgi:acyl carrier protein
MTQDAVDQIKLLVASILEPRLVARNISPSNLPDGFDLRNEGIIDSLGFIQLIVELETMLEQHIDLSDLDPEMLTNVDALSRHIAHGRAIS